jgi:hypothetical protein
MIVDDRLRTHGTVDRARLAVVTGDRSNASSSVSLAPRRGGLLGGTCVLTQDGYLPIEQLRHGDIVATLLGRGPMFVPVVWVGRRRVLAATDRGALDVPVRIRPHAIADDMPSRDVRLAPDHALYVAGRLYPVRQLINGATLFWDVPRAGPYYWAIQLERHDIMLADGLPVETLIDQAARVAFETVSGPRLRVVARAGM